MLEPTSSLRSLSEDLCRSAGGASGRIRYLPLADVQGVREIGLSWPADRRLLPAAELFRRHVIQRARSGGVLLTS